MKERDLIIGCNYYHEEYGGPRKVVLFEAANWYRIGDCVDMVENYSGIELTEDWLYNFGAKKIGWYSNYSAIAFEYGDWFLEWNNPSKKMSICNFDDVIFEVDCEYVHQLQNLIYSLTKNELKYEDNGEQGVSEAG